MNRNKTFNHITANSVFLNKLAVTDNEAVNNQSMEDRVTAGITRIRSLVLAGSDTTTLPRPCTLRRVDFAVQTAPAADTFTFEILKDGVGTGVTLNHTGADRDIPWTGLSVSFAAGEECSIGFSTTGVAAGTINHALLFEFE